MELGWPATGTFHVLLGTLFFTIKPYRIVWMSHIDGLIFTLVGVSFFCVTFGNKPVYMVGAGCINGGYLFLCNI